MKAIIRTIKRIFAAGRIVQSEVPLIVYLAVIAGMTAAWFLRRYHDDLFLNLLTELMGIAFIVFIIDTLLVRSKTKRWRIVRGRIDYLIARTVNRLRDGIATRAFNFAPDVAGRSPRAQAVGEVRRQRASLLEELEARGEEELARRLHEPELFSESGYEYFNEKADDVWDILNMKYAEYLAPELVTLLIDLHTNLKDLCGHIRQYRKRERFAENGDYYRAIGIAGAVVSLGRIIAGVNRLKRIGYSEAAGLADGL